MVITKQIAQAVGQRIVELAKDSIKREFGLDIRKGSGKYDDTSYTFKVEATVPLDKMEKVKTGGVTGVDDKMVKAGLAPRGTVVTIGDKTFTVLKARRTRYVVQGADGKQYTALFIQCNLMGGKVEPKRSGRNRFDGLPKTAVDAFESLECRLSPENLACDGEIPTSEVHKRYRQCMNEWATLENRYGVQIEPYV